MVDATAIIITSERRERLVAVAVAAGLEVLESQDLESEMIFTLEACPPINHAHCRIPKDDFGKRGKKGKSKKNWQV